MQSDRATTKPPNLFMPSLKPLQSSQLANLPPASLLLLPTVCFVSHAFATSPIRFSLHSTSARSPGAFSVFAPIRLISSVEIHPETKAAPQRTCGPGLSRSIAPSHGPTENAKLNDIVYSPMYSPRLPAGAISAAYEALPGIRIISPKVHTATAAKTPAGPLPLANDPKPMA